MEICCSFGDGLFTNGFYTCKIEYQQIPSGEELKFIGKHLSDKTNEDVTEIVFSNCMLEEFPQGLTKYFPNIKSFCFEGTRLKTITKSNLNEYKNSLSHFCCVYSYIDILPGNLFEDCRLLESICINNFTPMVVSPNILEGLENLKYVYFYNEKWKSSTLNENQAVSSNHPKLREIKSQLLDNFLNEDKENWKKLFVHLMSKIQKHKKLGEENEKNQAELDEKIEENRKLLAENENLKAENEDILLERENLNNKIDNLEDINQELMQQKHELTENAKVLEQKFAQIQQIIGDPQDNPEKCLDDLQNLLNGANYPKQQTVPPNLIQFLRTDEIFRNLTISIGGKQFRVHKLLLAARSPTLADIFSNNPDAGNLNLVDIPIDIFEKILKFIYNDELPCDNDENFLALFAAVGRLRIEKLKEYAAMKLMDQINDENALEILMLSNKYAHDGLRKKAFGKLKERYRNVVFEDEWLTDGEKVDKIIGYFKKMEQLEMEIATALTASKI